MGVLLAQLVRYTTPVPKITETPVAHVLENTSCVQMTSKILPI